MHKNIMGFLSLRDLLEERYRYPKVDALIAEIDAVLIYHGIDDPGFPVLIGRDQQLGFWLG